MLDEVFKAVDLWHAVDRIAVADRDPSGRQVSFLREIPAYLILFS
jgi:hypothetical protein